MSEQEVRPRPIMCRKHRKVMDYWQTDGRLKFGGKWCCRQCLMTSMQLSVTDKTPPPPKERVLVDRKNPYKDIFSAKKTRAKHAGVPFTLLFEDVVFPEYCPVLGIKLNYKRGHGRKGSRRDSPSFDRIDPTKGYIQGNVIIVSMLANNIKSNATPDEILAVGNFYKQLVTS